MDAVLAIGILIIIGFFGGVAARRFKLPRVSGYIIVGMLLSPSLLNVIPHELIHGQLTIITDVALGIIAYLIGGSLNLEALRKLRRTIAWIVPFEGFGAWIFVTLLIAFLGHLIIRFTIPAPNFYQTSLPMAIIIGAVSLATAPAATIAIIHEYRARGPFTTTLLSVVALDDALAIIAYAIATGIAGTIIAATNLSLSCMIVIPILRILGSILLGVGFGFGLSYAARLARTRSLLLVIVLGTILFCIGAAKLLGLSPLLANMAIGFTIINRLKGSKNMFRVINDIEDVIFAVFFTLAGAHLDLDIIKVAGILALLIVIGRCTGKYLGTRIGATISHAPESVKKYLGLGLLPKAGVTIGLVLLAKQNPAFSAIGPIMVNGVLASTIINELIAPPLTKYAIFKSGEAEPPYK